MSSFRGFPPGKIPFTRIPGPFFSELLPAIDDLYELKLAVYALWHLDKMEGKFRFLRKSDFLDDSRFLSGMGETENIGETNIRESITTLVERGMFLEAILPVGGNENTIYFLNTEKGKAAVEAIQRGEWAAYVEKEDIPLELTRQKPNIFQLYEKNIGLLTPILSESLRDAADEYPGEWIEEAFKIAVENNIRNWRYISKILQRWSERGFYERKDQRDTGEGHKKDFRRFTSGRYADHIETGE